MSQTRFAENASAFGRASVLAVSPALAAGLLAFRDVQAWRAGKDNNLAIADNTTHASHHQVRITAPSSAAAECLPGVAEAQRP